jgi:hypothetical protein
MVFRTITYAMGFKRNFGRQGSRGKRGGADGGPCENRESYLKNGARRAFQLEGSFPEADRRSAKECRNILKAKNTG